MPNDLTSLVDRPGFYQATVDERGPRYRRALLPPVGSDEPIYLPPDRPEPWDLLGAPEPFPLEWIERPPAWLQPGEDVRIAMHGPDKGRVAGYIRLHGTCYQDGTSKCRMPPEVPLDEFHHSRLPVIDDDGRRVDALGGVISIVGGHSDQVGAADHVAAKQWAQRPEWAKLRGVIVRDDVGDLFLGAARPDLTVAEANIVNAGQTSGEWWPLYEPGPDGKPRLVGSGSDLIGIVLVASGAFRKRQPEAFRTIAAAIGAAAPTDDEVADLEAWLAGPAPRWLCGYHGTARCECAAEDFESADGHGPPPPVYVPVAVDQVVTASTSSPVPAGALAEHVRREVARQLAALPSPLRAVLDSQVADLEAAVSSLRVDVDQLREDHASLEGRFTAFQIEQTDEESLTLPEAVADNEAEIEELRDRIDELAAEVEQDRGGAVNSFTVETAAPAEPEPAA